VSGLDIRVYTALSPETLDQFKEILMDALDPIRQQLDEVKTILSAEIAQIAAKLAGTPTPEAVESVRLELEQLGQNIQAIIPDAPPPAP
jgi:hypothetical protein